MQRHQSREFIMSGNIESMMNHIDEMYSRDNINSELPPDEVLVQDAYSEMEELEIRKKAGDIFDKRNTNAEGALRIKSQLLDRKQKVIDAEQNKEHAIVLGTSSFHTRTSPEDAVAKTKLEKFMGVMVGCIAVFMPIIICTALAMYMMESGLIGSIYDNPFITIFYCIPAATLCWLMKQVEDRICTTEQSKRRYIRVITILACVASAVWIFTFASIFSLSDAGSPIEEAWYFPIVSLSFTISQILSEILIGAALWSYLTFKDSRNKNFIIYSNEVYEESKFKEEELSAASLSTLLHSEQLISYAECFTKARDAFVQNYLNAIHIHRCQMKAAGEQARLNYVNVRVQKSNILTLATTGK